MKSKKTLIFLFIFFVFSLSELYAQNTRYSMYEDEYAFKKGLWYRIDFRQKVNIPFFSEEREITRIIIDAVKADSIQPYWDDDLHQKMTKAAFFKNLKIPYAGAELTDVEKEIEGVELKEKGDDDPEYYFPKQLFFMELKEYYRFDRISSRMYHDIETATLYIPAEINPTGLDKILGCFDFNELMEKVFKGNKNAIWYNPNNNAYHLSFADAFTQRLFSSKLVKYENPKTGLVIEMYQGKRALQTSEQIILKLLEFEALNYRY